MNIAYDLSGHQKGIDIERLVNERNPPWLAFKLTEAQGFIDRESIKLLDRALALGVPCSGYHFAWANKDPVAQAQGFVNQDALHFTTANPVIDIEGAVREGKIFDVPEVGPSAALHTYRILVEEVEQRTARNAIVYTSPGFIQTFFSEKAIAESDDAVFLGKHALWVAHYGVSAPAIPLFWKLSGRAPSGWQYDGGKNTASPDGFKLDANQIFELSDFVPGARAYAPRPIEIVDPRGPLVTVDEFLALLERPGGQTGV